MDNPQHYQPLSHALHPPQAQAQPYTSTGMFNSKVVPMQSTHREEEEEEEEDGDDEGLVEEQLSRQEPEGQGSNPSSPRTKPTGTDARTAPMQHQQDDSQERKRRPGRPRGSKNRKPRVGQAASKQEANFYAGVTPPQHPDVNAHNQQYYEFQWRVLNLCAEFYGAAEELVKGTRPLVIAQCYQMGPANKVDPLIMLGEAKRICDTLLANPSQLISTPPPPIYSVTPTLYQPVQTQPVASASAPVPPSISASKSSTPSTVISNPGTFVMPLQPSQTGGYPHTQYSMYAPPGQYPTTSYYQYSYVATPGSYYTQPQQSGQAQPPAQSQPAPTQPAQPEASSSSGAANSVATATVITASTGAGGNQGAWSDEETERLKKLAEDSRAVGTGGEMEWDWVVHQWGNGRTRHQILIKATSLGLKESSSRGVKRRRENEPNTSDAASPSVPPTPTNAHAHASTTNPPPTTAAASHAPSASPAHSQTASTPAASPALQNQQRPAPKATGSGLPWPMPTMAVNTTSPVLAATSAGGQEPQRTSYYRARPNQDASASLKPPSTTTHPYMYQPNGSAGSSRLGKENGK